MAKKRRPPGKQQAREAKTSTVRLHTTSLPKKGQLPQGIVASHVAETHIAIDAALQYASLGLSIVPQLPGEKKPAVRWKEFQTRLPSSDELHDWFANKWPNAGMAVILGPVSGLLVVDVDGREANNELISRLGQIPDAPRVMSGSGDPHRYHLYFRHPDFLTRAKNTAWHPQLEFRGQSGIVIAPPSLHKSGNRYRWAKGRSPWEMAPPEVPDEILESLRSGRRRLEVANQAAPVELTPQQMRLLRNIMGISRATNDFLNGCYANGPDWNGRLLRAACDMAGIGVSIDQATPLLFRGAAPWDGELGKAMRTIESAFSEKRTSASKYAAAQVVPSSCPPAAMPAFAKAFKQSVKKIIPKKRARKK